MKLLFTITILVTHVAANITTEDDLIDLDYDVDCPKGSSSADGKNREGDECAQCFDGEYSNLEGQTFCDLCPAGEYTPDFGYWTCLKCPKGHINSEEGSFACDPCPSGSYNPVEGGTECLNCLAGNYQDEHGAGECKPCTEGTYQESPNKEQCDKCPAGQSSPKGSSSLAACQDCKKGTFSDSPGSRCEQCPVLTYSDIEGATACKDCPSNTDKMGATECKISCKEGEVLVDGSCNPCPKGQFAKIGDDSCTLCSKGHFSAVEGSSSCTVCPVKTYSPTEGAERCLACKDNNKEGMETCDVKCGDGEIVSDGKCVACPVGHYKSSAKQCSPCFAGTYADQVGSEICSKCGAGTFSAVKGSSNCDACPEGTFQDEEGQTVCKECAAGSYEDLSGSVTCKHCSPGFYNPTAKATKCQECAPGSITEIPGQLVCQACEAGSFSISTIACNLCAPGSFSEEDGATSCELCPAGTYADDEGYIFCETSPAGTYSPEGSVHPVPCPAGSFCPEESATPTPCAMGYYQEMLGQVDCAVCPEGSYCSGEGLVTPSGYCPIGSYCPTGSVSPISCPKGKSTQKEGAGALEDCIETDCNVGYFKEDGICKICPRGTYSNMKNSLECTKCPKNTYNSAEGSTHCLRCPDTAYTWDTGAASFDQCIGPIFEVCSEKNLEGSCHRYFDDSLEMNMTIKSFKAIRGDFDLYDLIGHRGRSERITEGTGMDVPFGKLNAVRSMSVILNDVFCSLDRGQKFRGSVRSVSKSGKACINWKDTPMASKAKHNNLCQNPTMPEKNHLEVEPKPFCYTSKTEMEECDIPSCIWDMDCYSGVGVQYRGKQRYTSGGHMCQAWNSNFPHPHGYHPPNYRWAGVGNHNLCSNPSPAEASRPWCYSRNLFVIWDYCRIPKCTREKYEFYKF